LVLIIYKEAGRSFVYQPVKLFILFSAVMGKQFYKNPSKKEIEEAFRYFDKDKSG
jgi:Ca2+-binding EF-hand superfamily protein